jgi:hypothetical protein
MSAAAPVGPFAAADYGSLGSVWHVYSDKIVAKEESDAPGGEHGDGLGTP